MKAYDLDVGKREFAKKIKAKIGCGYREIEISYEEEEKEEKKQGKKAGGAPKSKLPDKVKELMELIFDDKQMSSTLQKIGYDAKKLPLGKLSEKVINEGYDILSQISKAITKKQSTA